MNVLGSWVRFLRFCRLTRAGIFYRVPVSCSPALLPFSAGGKSNCTSIHEMLSWDHQSARMLSQF